MNFIRHSQSIFASTLMAASLISCSGVPVKKTEMVRKLASAPVMMLADKESQVEYENFQNLIEEALAWRGRAMDFFEEVSATRKETGYMSAHQIEKMRIAAISYLDLHDKILEIAKKHSWIVSWKTKVEFKPGAGTSFGKTTAFPWRRGFLPTKVPKAVIDPSDEAGRKAMLNLKMSMAAALVLYDNYIFGVLPFWEDKATRTLIDEDYPEIRGRLQRATKEFVRQSNRRKLAKSIALFDREFTWREVSGQGLVTQEDDYLDLLIRQSASYNYSLQGKEKGPDRMDFVEGHVAENLLLSKKAMTFYLSKFFGNGMGLVAFRKGKLQSLVEPDKQALAASLKPLDILLEKTPFRLTDKFIPGHWGHVAIWVGGEQDLKAAGVWDHKAVVPYHAKILAGARIIEALRPGVQINTLDHFLNIDDILALRYKNPIDPETQRADLIRAFSQIGKEYDFNFDVETDKRIVCSEIAYVVYHDIKWPTEKTLGRYTISPDHVAIKGLADGPLEPVLIYYDGKKMPQDLNGGLTEILRLLVETRYDELASLLQSGARN